MKSNTIQKFLSEHAVVLAVTAVVWMSLGGVSFYWLTKDYEHDNSDATSLIPTQERTVRIQYQTVAGSLMKVGAQRIFFASEDSVRQAWRPVLAEHFEQVARYERQIRGIDSDIAASERDLEDARDRAAKAYRSEAPNRSSPQEKPSLKSKQRFRQILTESGDFERADDAAGEVVVDKIQPLKDRLESLRLSRARSLQGLHAKQSNLQNLMFDSLPQNAKFVTTDEDGVTKLDVSSDVKNYCWADFSKALPGGRIERLRWLLLMPDDLDSNGIAIMSHDNTFENAPVSVVRRGAGSDHVISDFGRE